MARSYVKVRFENDHAISYNQYAKTYTYYVEGHYTELQHFNYAVVDSPSTGYTVVCVIEISEVDESNFTGTVKRVVDLFSDSEYKDALKRDERRKAIMKELDKRAKEAAARKNYEQLLADDESAQALLKELKSL